MASKLSGDPLPSFIEIDGRRYLWRDLVALRRAQAKPAERQPTLFALREDHRPVGERNAAERYWSRACSPCWSGINGYEQRVTPTMG